MLTGTMGMQNKHRTYILQGFQSDAMTSHKFSKIQVRDTHARMLSTVHRLHPGLLVTASILQGKERAT